MKKECSYRKVLSSSLPLKTIQKKYLRKNQKTFFIFWPPKINSNHSDLKQKAAGQIANKIVYCVLMRLQRPENYGKERRCHRRGFTSLQLPPPQSLSWLPQLDIHKVAKCAHAQEAQGQRKRSLLWWTTSRSPSLSSQSITRPNPNQGKVWAMGKSHPSPSSNVTPYTSLPINSPC